MRVAMAMGLARGPIVVALLASADVALGNVGRTAAGPAAVQYADVVRLPDSAGWRQISDTTTQGERVQEYVPAGQGAADWSELITVKVLPRTRDPKPVVQGTVTLMREICGNVSIVNTAQSQQLGEVANLGMMLPVFEAAETLVTCKNPDVTLLRQKLGTGRVTLRRYEVTWYKMMKAQRANYIVQRAWHGDEMDENSVLGSPGVLDAWKQWITHVTLLRQASDGGQN